MSLGKYRIVKNIVSKTQISHSISRNILNAFIDIIKAESPDKPTKISKFGTFYSVISPSRIGRNPKTKISYKIPVRKKLAFKASKNIRYLIN